MDPSDLFDEDEADDDVEQCSMMLDVAIEKAKERCGDGAFERAMQSMGETPGIDVPSGPTFTKERLMDRINDAYEYDGEDCGRIAAELVNVTSAASFLYDDHSPERSEIDDVEYATNNLIDKLDLHGCLDSDQIESLRTWEGYLLDGMDGAVDSYVTEADHHIQKIVFDLI